jgi:hypothetical protein
MNKNDHTITTLAIDYRACVGEGLVVAYYMQKRRRE